MSVGSRPTPSRTGIVATYLLFAAQVLRTLTADGVQERLSWYLALLLAYLILLTFVFWRPHLPTLVGHAYLFVQSALILALLSLNPEVDHLAALFLPPGYQVAHLFAGRTRWVWIGVFAFLIGGPLTIYHGAIEGLALGLTTIAAIVVLPAFVAVNQEIETARAESATMLQKLQETNARLEACASQVEELAEMQERNRLARELHDSVSQTMSGITSNIRAAQVHLAQDPETCKPQLEQLQALIQSALAQMRSLIAELRPQSR